MLQTTLVLTSNRHLIITYARHTSLQMIITSATANLCQFNSLKDWCQNRMCANDCNRSIARERLFPSICYALTWNQYKTKLYINDWQIITTRATLSLRGWKKLLVKIIIGCKLLLSLFNGPPSSHFRCTFSTFIPPLPPLVLHPCFPLQK